MLLALASAVAAALCSGAAAVLQARSARADAARRPSGAAGVDPGLLLRLARSPSYVAGLALVAAGFGLALLALRVLPVFVVAVARASSLGVTAVLAWLVMGTPLRARDAGALTGVGVGLVLVAASARTGVATPLPLGLRGGLLAAVVVIIVVAAAVGRRLGSTAGGALAVLAGLAFGIVGVAARALSADRLADLPTDPALLALGAAGLCGLLLYASALQRLPVTSATATMVSLETLSGAAAGVLLLGDGTRPGWVWTAVAAAGTLVALAGAIVLTGAQPGTADRPAARLARGPSVASGRDRNGHPARPQVPGSGSSGRRRRGLS